MDPADVVRYLSQVEEAAEDVLADKQEIVNLDHRRNKNREAIRCLINESKTTHPPKTSWVCFGNTFLKLPVDNAKKLLEKDQKKIDEEIDDLRKNLKPKVNKLRDLEGKPELQSFYLKPLSSEEMAAVNQVLKGSFR